MFIDLDLLELESYQWNFSAMSSDIFFHWDSSVNCLSIRCGAVNCFKLGSHLFVFKYDEWLVIVLQTAKNGCSDQLWLPGVARGTATYVWISSNRGLRTQLLYWRGSRSRGVTAGRTRSATSDSITNPVTILLISF